MELRKLALALIVSLALILPATVSAQAPIYTAQLSGSNRTSSTGQFNLASEPNKTAYIDAIFSTDTSWSSFNVTVDVQPGNSVSVTITDPSGFEVTSGTVAGQPETFSSQPSSITAGKPYTINIVQISAAGPTDIVQVTVSGTTPPAPPVIVPPPPPSPPYWLYAAIVVVAAAALLAFLYVRRSGEAEQEMAPPAMAPMPPSGPSPFGGGETTVIQGGGATKQYYAGFEMPGGQVVPITDVNKEFGRDDFKAYLPVDVQTLISRRHFKVSFSPREKTFLIEDLGSANGTMVNNSEIKGKGRVPLKNDDVVSLGGVVNMKFKG